MKGKGWRGEPAPKVSHVERLAFILTVLGEGLQRLAFGGVPHRDCGRQEAVRSLGRG